MRERHNRRVRAHVAALDGLRFVAATLVVLTHAAFLTGSVTTTGLLGRLMGRGDLGVLIFFVLSGYLLHHGFVRARSGAPVSTTAYLSRRAARVLPAYWLVLVVVAIAAHPSARDVVLHAAAAQIYVAEAQITGYSQSWSIATEVSFYLCLPVAAWGLARAARRNPDWPAAICAAAVPLGIGITWLTSSRDLLTEVPYERWLPACSATFALGMLLAEVRARPSHVVSRWLGRLAAAPGPLLAVGGAAYLLATTPVAGKLTLGTVDGSRLAVKMTLGCIVAGAFLLPLILGPGNLWRATLAHPWAAGLGRISYGIFLWHVPVFTALYAVSGLEPFSGGLIPLLAFGMPITLGLAAVTYRFVERPLLARTRSQDDQQREQARRAGADLDPGRA